MKLLTIAVFLIASAVARADTYHYDVEFSGLTFSFDEPYILTSDTTIPEDGSPITSIEIDPLSCSNGLPSYPCIIEFTPMVEEIWGFGTAFDKVGLYLYDPQEPDYDTQVSITDETQVPEPTPFVLLATGLLGFGLFLRKGYGHIMPSIQSSCGLDDLCFSGPDGTHDGTEHVFRVI